MKLSGAILVMIGLLGFLVLIIIPTERLQDHQDYLNQNLLYIDLALVVIIAFGWAMLESRPNNVRRKEVRQTNGA